MEEGEEAGFVVQEDSCGWHMRTLKSVTGLQETDIVHASFESEVRKALLNQYYRDSIHVVSYPAFPRLRVLSLTV